VVAEQKAFFITMGGPQAHANWSNKMDFKLIWTSLKFRPPLPRVGLDNPSSHGSLKLPEVPQRLKAVTHRTCAAWLKPRPSYKRRQVSCSHGRPGQAGLSRSKMEEKSGMYPALNRCCQKVVESIPTSSIFLLEGRVKAPFLALSGVCCKA
jgi:hypothetical protein